MAIGDLTQYQESFLYRWVALEGLRIFQGSFTLWQGFHKADCRNPQNSVFLLEQTANFFTDTGKISKRNLLEIPNTH